MTDPNRQPITVSIFEIFKIGIGPSSSHTMGPMIAAQHFRQRLLGSDLLSRVATLVVTLHGSLGATGKGHATDRAVIAGLTGVLPASAAGSAIQDAVARVQKYGALALDSATIPFDAARHLRWEPLTENLPHPNTIDFEILDTDAKSLLRQRYLSVGGGFVEIVDGETGSRSPLPGTVRPSGTPRHAFRNALELTRVSKKKKLSWARIALENEIALTGRSEAEILASLLDIWRVMRACIARGIAADADSKLPGPLKVRRRAPNAYEAATSTDRTKLPLIDPVELLAHAYALAVNEENASGHQVVTAPTNGAAGVIPAAFAALQDRHRLPDADICRGLMTASIIGAIIKREASLSGAEMGCQGEVGSASAMAAGGIVEIMNGTSDQVEMAAEIAIEHHLGMTCDPIAGLVQIPCIERNVMGAVKSLNAATLALSSDGKHRVTLDEAIAAMRQIGLDMNAKYKETARGGLATAAHAPHHVAC